MSDALVVPFRSQLSVIMESVLQSAVVEITRLVEESFVEEVARGKRELELLLRRLQSSESKLQERERRGRCTDCVRAERTTGRTTGETLTGEDALCLRLSLREPSGKRSPLARARRPTPATGEDPPVPTETRDPAPPRVASTPVPGEDVGLAGCPARPKSEPGRVPVTVKEERETPPLRDGTRDVEDRPGSRSHGETQVDRPLDPSHPRRDPPPPLLERLLFLRRGSAGGGGAASPPERPHACPACGKAFARLSNFKQHLNIHTHERLFGCAQCGMSFKRSTHLRVHLRRHARALLGGGGAVGRGAVGD